MPGLWKADWERDVVYLVQFPRAPTIPSLSMYSLKLETWLRMADLKYENITNNMMGRSKKGQVPFIELNGQEVADSNFIIDHLKEFFHVDIDSHLAPEQAAMGTAFHALIEDQIAWVLIYQRSFNIDKMFADGGITANLPALMRIASPVAQWRFSSIMKSKCHAQGIGRHSLEEAEGVAKKGLKAVSTFLGKNSYMLGDKISSVDATAFGHLSQLWWGVPKNTELTKFLGSQCPNLVQYLERIKTTYWPDWETAVGDSKSMSSDWKVNPKDEVKPDETTDTSNA